MLTLQIFLSSILYFNTRMCTMTKKLATSTRSRQTTKTKSSSPPTIDTSKLPDQLKDLRLPTFRELHVTLADQAAREQWTHSQYLAHLVDQECQSRYQSRIVRLTRDANLLAGKTWEEFQWSRVPLHVTQQFETLRQGNFLDRQDNVLIFGRPGSGKTMLLSALGDQLVKKGRPVLFRTCQMLVQELLRAKRDLRLERVIKKLHKFEALIIDDLGYVQQSREEMEVLFTLLSERYERGSVLLSSNLPFSKWEQIFKDPMTTAAAIDRLIHHSVIVELNNISSFRLDEAKKKQLESIDSADGLEG
jgi:DNA replication protein DnaC